MKQILLSIASFLLVAQWLVPIPPVDASLRGQAAVQQQQQQPPQASSNTKDRQLQGAPVLLWTEDFSALADGTTSDAGADSAWTVDTSNVVAPALFEVFQDEFRASNTDGEGVWTSEVIDIAGAGAVDISVDIRKEGNMEADYDYLRLAYKLDGGSEQLFAERLGNFQAETVRASGSSLSGNTLQIVIRERTSYQDEFHYWDNVAVSYLPVVVPPPTEPTAPVPTEPAPLAPAPTAPAPTQPACKVPWSGPNYLIAMDEFSATESIDTSCVGGAVVISMNIGHQGALETTGTARDTVRVYYTIDNGPEQLWLDIAGDQYSSPVQVNVGSASQVTIRVTGRTTHVSESYQVTVAVAEAPPTPAPTPAPTPGPTAPVAPTPPTAPPPFSFDDGKWLIVDNDAPIDQRNEACFVMVGRKAYLVGGRGNKDLDIYDPVQRQWSKVSLLMLLCWTNARLLLEFISASAF